MAGARTKLTRGVFRWRQRVTVVTGMGGGMGGYNLRWYWAASRSSSFLSRPVTLSSWAWP